MKEAMAPAAPGELRTQAVPRAGPSELDRDTMVLPTIDREKCMGCGRCYLSCQDGGHQAISFDHATRQPRIMGSKCVGCHLCRLVCPTGAIGMSKRFPLR